MADRLRWGIVSTARIGQDRFIPGVRWGKLGEVVAIASRDAAKAQAVADKLSIPRAHGSYEALLDDPQVDAVYIGLPNALHHPWTIRAAQAGKHVLCEKPVARAVAPAEEMAAACRAANVIFMEAFMYRHHPQHERVRALLAEGAIGEPRLVRATFGFTLRDATTNIRASRELEGGSLMDVGCYGVNAARYLFAAEPVEVTAFQHVAPEYGVDMSFAAVLRFPGDRLALIDSSFEASSGGRYELSGPRGSLFVERAFVPGDAAVPIRLSAGGAARVEEVAGVNQYGLEADHFARSVQAGRLLPPAEDGVANTRVVAALYRSAEEGRAVAVGTGS